MKKNLNGLNITYRFHKGEGVPILLLHGWGGSLNSFRFLENYFVSKNCSVITIDFPGFGGSDMPLETFELDDYYKIVSDLLMAENIQKVNIVAHSFGGRVALLLTYNEPQKVNKLVLTDSAGLKPKFSLSKKIKIIRYKFLKKLKEKGLIKRDLVSYGSEDYKAMPQNLKQVFVRIVNRHLDYILPSVSCPTLIVWGKDDDATPYYMAKKFKKNIKDSGLVTLDGGHFAYLQNANKFTMIVDNFFNKENVWTY